MGNGFSVSRPRRALQQESKWTIVNGQVMWDGRPWPPGGNKVAQHAEVSGQSRHKRARTGPDEILPSTSNKSKIDSDQFDDIEIVEERTVSNLKYCQVTIPKLNIKNLKRLQDMRALDTCQVKRKRGRPRKYSLKQEEIEDAILVSDNDSTDVTTNKECLVENHRPKEKLVEQEIVNTEGTSNVTQDQNKAARELLKKKPMSRTYSVSSVSSSSTEHEVSSCSDDENDSCTSSESEIEEPDIVSFEDIRYDTKCFYAPKLLVKNDQKELHDKVVKQLVNKQCNFFDIQNRFFGGANLIRDLNCYVKQEYCNALKRFKNRTSLQIQLMLLMVYLRHKIDSLKDEKRILAHRTANIKISNTKNEKKETEEEE